MLHYTWLGFSIFQLAFYFIVYAFGGWILEFGYAWYQEGRFINRGFLFGPFCPIYAFGALALIIALQPWLGSLLVLFLGSALLASMVEYVTGFGLEKLFNQKCWDYGDRPFNLHGRISLRFSIYWGIGGVILLRYIQPLVNELIEQIPYVTGSIVIYIMAIYFAADFIYSVRSALELKSLHGKLIALGTETREMLENLKESSHEALEQAKEEIRTRYEATWQQASSGTQRLLEAFPSLRNKHYERMIKAITEKWEPESKQDRD